MPDIELQKAEYHRRRRKKVITFFQLFLGWSSVILVLYFGFTSVSSRATISSPAENFLRDTVRSSTFLSHLGLVKDTIYILHDSYLELRLDSQRVFHRWKDGSVDSFNVSTGTTRLRKGIETPEGIFVVQSKIGWLYSVQFDSAKVYNWLGFHNGIGFHSLDGSRYYAHLGKRPSSHGCIRLSRENAEHLFQCVGIGTPVFVHRGNTARTLAFLHDTLLADRYHYSKAEVRSIFSRRLQHIYRGLKYYDRSPLIPLDRSIVSHAGFEVGDAQRIPSRQIIPRAYELFTNAAATQTYVHKRQFQFFALREDSTSIDNLEKEILP